MNIHIGWLLQHPDLCQELSDEDGNPLAKLWTKDTGESEWGLNVITTAEEAIRHQSQ